MLARSWRTPMRGVLGRCLLCIQRPAAAALSTGFGPSQAQRFRPNPCPSMLPSLLERRFSAGSSSPFTSKPESAPELRVTPKDVDVDSVVQFARTIGLQLQKEVIDGRQFLKGTKEELVKLYGMFGWPEDRLDAVKEQAPDILIEAASREEDPVTEPVPFTRVRGVKFVPRMELVPTVLNALDSADKTSVLAVLSTPGTGKSRLLDEMCSPETLASLRAPGGEGYTTALAHGAPIATVIDFLKGLAASQRVNLTFNQGNGSLLGWELDLPVQAALAIRVLHACYRSSMEDKYFSCRLRHVAQDLFENRRSSLEALTTADVLAAVFPGRRCALFIDEVQLMGENLSSREAQVQFIRKLGDALAVLDAVSTSGSITAIVAGSDLELLRDGFAVTNTVLETLALPPFTPDQALEYVDRFLLAHGRDLHPEWRTTPWLRDLVVTLGTIPRLLERGLTAICRYHVMDLPHLLSMVRSTSYLNAVMKQDTRRIVMAVLVQATIFQCPHDIAQRLVVTGALCEVSGHAYMPPIALRHWANESLCDLGRLLKEVFKSCNGMTWEDFEHVANAATAARMMALHDFGRPIVSLHDLFFLEGDADRAMGAYLGSINVSLPAAVKLAKAEASFRLPERVPCHNILLRNKPSASSADSVMQLSVVGHDVYKSVTIAFRDKLVTSREADISSEPGKVFGPGHDTGVKDNDLLLLVIRSPFPVKASDTYEADSIASGRPVVLLHGRRFNRLLKAILPPANCLNTLSVDQIKTVLACTKPTALAVLNGRPWLGLDDLASRVPVNGKGAESRWAKMVDVARRVHAAGLLFF